MSPHRTLAARIFPAALGVALLACFTARLPASRPHGTEPDRSARPPVPVRPDLSGDPLPAGAISRAGTLHFRHGDDVNQVAFAPDGKTVYSACQVDKLARAWSVADGRELHHFGGEAGVVSVAVAPDGRWLATGEDDNTIRLWDTATGQEVRRLSVRVAGEPRGRWRGGNRLVRGVRFSPGGKTVIALHAQDNAVVVWDAATGQEVRRITDAGHMTTAFDLSTDGKTLVTGSTSGNNTCTLHIWNADTGRSVRTLSGHADQILALALSPDGKALVSAATDQTVRFWDVAGGKERHHVQVPTYATAVAASPDGTTAAYAFDDPEEGGIVQLCDFSGHELRRLAGNVRGTEALAFAPDGKTLATGGGGHVLRLWDVATGKEVRPAAAHPGPVTTVALSPDGKLLATCSNLDTTVRLWDTATGREVRRLDGHATGVDEVTFSPDGKLLAAAAYDQPVLLWEVATGRLAQKLADHACLGPYIRFADDGKTIATANQESSVGVWDCATGKLIRELAAPPNGIASMLTFNDGRLLAFERGDPEEAGETTVALWDLTAYRVVRRFTGHRGLVNGLALSADGRSVASRGSDRTIRVWEVTTGQERCRFRDPGELNGWTGTQFLAFAPDGRTLVTAATLEPLARRWDLPTGQQLAPLTGHRGWVGAVEFSADGRLLVTGSQDTTCLLWDATPADRPSPRAATRLPEAELAKLWDELGGHDAGKAYRALWALAAAGDQAASFIGERLRSPPPTDARQIARWIAELDHPQFPVRERATAALMQVADQAEEALRTALERTHSAEVRQRVRRILSAALEVDLSPERLREVRAVEVLEQIATPPARQVLAALAHGPAGAALTREARTALRRLEQH